jgi:hypothetical protein
MNDLDVPALQKYFQHLWEMRKGKAA